MREGALPAARRRGAGALRRLAEWIPFPESREALATFFPGKLIEQKS